MLCHIKSISIEEYEVLPGIKLPCQDNVQTVYEIRFNGELPPIFTKELLDLYAHGVASTAASTSGYNITFVSGSGKYTTGRYAMTISEPTTGSIAESLCAMYQTGTYIQGHYACYISAVYADNKAYCKRMDLCKGDGTTAGTSDDNGAVKEDSGVCGKSPILSLLSLVVLLLNAFFF